MGITKIVRGVHFIHETPVVKVLRNRLNDPDLITYKHAQTNQWVLAYWVDRTKGLVDEIDDLGFEFELVTPEFIRSLERSRGATNFRVHRDKIIEKRRRQHQKWLDDVEQSNDERGWLRKRGVQGPYGG